MTIEVNPRNEADVQVLRKRYTDLEPDGRVIRHDELEAVLGLSRTEARYRTVIAKWRKVLWDESQLYLDGMSAEGQGFRVLNGNQMVQHGNKRLRWAGRSIKTAVRVLATPRDDEITDPHARNYRARALVVAEQLVVSHGRSMRELTTALKAPKQLRAPTTETS